MQEVGRRLMRCGFVGLVIVLMAGPSGATTAVAAGPTYHREVVRILQKQCQDCHRPGEVAPFPLLTYAQAKKHAADMVDVAETRRMPPWPASTEVGGPFRDARVLTPGEIATLAAWVKN